MEKKRDGVYDGFRELGAGRMMVLGLQHVFAMFGATVLVPLLTGLSVSVTLFCAGVGTILFFFITKRKVPIFLGSSFAFLAAFATVANGDPALLPYATLGVVAAGVMYLLLALVFGIFGAKRVMKLFPPVVTGPIIILIGLTLAPTAVNSASANWILAILAIVIILVVNVFGKGMLKILPILIGIFGAYIIGVIVSLCSNNALFGLPWVDFSSFSNMAATGQVVGIPPFADFSPLRFLFGAQSFDKATAVSSIITFVVVALAAMIEHIGDVCAIGATCNRNFVADPGLTRTLIGDGLATSVAGLFGGPANTTYSENTGVVALTHVYDPRVMLIAAIMSILLSVLTFFEAFINTIPWSIIGGVSMVLYGMISATGVRTIVENKVDFKNMRNILVAALILVVGLGIQFSTAGCIALGQVKLGGLACAAIVGIVVNAVLPGKVRF